MKENIYNLPNFISAYRMAMFPVILFFAINNYLNYFTIFVCINLVTDILDGWIARRFNLETKLGAQLDSLADLGTYIMAIYGVFKFKWSDIQNDYLPLFLFIAIYLISLLIAWVRFKKMPGLHLYSCVATAYIQGFFFFALFTFGFNYSIYLFSMLFGTIAYLEKILVLFKLKDINSTSKGLYWMLRKEKKISE